MKTLPAFILSILVAPLFATSSFAQVKLQGDEGNGVKTYYPSELVKKSSDFHDGELVRLRFNYREPQITDGKEDGSKVGYVEARDQFGLQLKLLIPFEGAEWFDHVRTYSSAIYNDLNAKSYVVYGRVSTGKGGLSLRLIGTEIKHDDIDGDSVIWSTP
jgi:hypothetical protein